MIMRLEDKIEAQKKRMEQEKNKLDLLVKRQKQSSEKQTITGRLSSELFLKNICQSRGVSVKNRSDSL